MLKRLRSFLDRSNMTLSNIGDAAALGIFVSSTIILIYINTHFPESHPLTLFSFLYSAFAFILLIYKTGQWVPKLHRWLRTKWKAYDHLWARQEKIVDHKAKSTKFIYITLRVLTIFSAFATFFLGQYQNFLMCLLTLVLFTLPDMISKNMNVRLPSTLESIIYCFIFAAEILGEINNFYGLIPGWDTMLHTINGFLCAAIGFALVDMLNRHSKRLQLSPIYLALTAFCFSMTVGVVWEFIEYFGDKLFFVDMQKDTLVQEIKSILINPTGENVPLLLNGITSTAINMADGTEFIINGGYLDIGINDTMKDLLVNFLGAIIFSVFGYFYVNQRDHEQNSFVSRFIPIVEKDVPDELPLQKETV